MVRAADRRNPANRAARRLVVEDAADHARKPKIEPVRAASTSSGGPPEIRFGARPFLRARVSANYWGIPPEIHAAIASMSAFAIGPAGGMEPFRIDVREREAFALTFA